MFTGIIEAVGRLSRVQKHGSDLSITIHSETLDFSDVKLGDSIASNGVCLTVTALGKQSFDADLSAETLTHTLFSHYKIGQRINLEKAMLPTTRMGGHMVSGHVDGVSTVQRLVPDGRAVHIWLTLPEMLGRYIAQKGSVTIDGISLTVNELSADAFRLTIVPHTIGQTTISQLKAGSNVHLEVDLISRYLERLLNAGTADTRQGVTMSMLSQRGFI